MKKILFLVLFAGVSLLCPCNGQERISRSVEEIMAPFGKSDMDLFRSPEKINCPETWFHYIDGNVDKEGITKDLEAIAEVGISGVQLFHGGSFGGDWPGVKQHIECLSSNWDDAVAHTANESKRLGLRFTMQNCPGWAMSGGPWIEPKDAMRDLAWTRTDLEGGRMVGAMLPVPVRPGEEKWRDYTDVAVLAFPTPSGDTNGPAVPDRIFSDIDPSCWEPLFAGEKGKVVLDPVQDGGAHFINLEYDEPVTLRSIVFSSIQKFFHDYSYEPGIRVVVTAAIENGNMTILDSDMPMSNYQDGREMTFALDESTSCAFRITIANKYEMSITALRMLSAARKNNWEAEAAWTLRAIPYESENPYQSPEAFVSSESVLDISSCLSSDGVLRWNAPAGKWTVLRIGHINSGHKNGPAPLEATGWECDKLSTDGADIHFANYIKKIAEGPALGKLDAMLLDSWECNAQTWTVRMEEEFKSFNGYDLRPWMPALFGYVIDSHETTSRFLYDWRACINYLFSYKFYGRMAENARNEGLHIAYETAAGDVFPGDILEYFKYADVPMCEFWNNSTPTFVGSFNFKPIRPTASAAHVYGKTRVTAESFTSFDLTWDEHFSRLKDVANQNYAQGVTHSVLHTYTHNPCADTMVPGTSFGSGIGTPFLRGQTWWKHMPEFSAYLARLSYLLERGCPVSDILWYLGDGSMHKPDQDYAFPDGFKYDYCNQDVLLHRLSVVGGRLVTPEGISYSVLWMPDTHHMLPATAAKVRELVKAGAIVIGDAPLSLGTLVTSADVRGANGASVDGYDADVAAVWGVEEGCNAVLRHVGKGLVVSGMTLKEALDTIGIRPDLVDVETKKEPSAKWLHRRIGRSDWYFITSPLGESFSGILDFRCKGKASIWNPVDGSIVPVAKERCSGRGRSSVKVDLPYAGSCFVVFSHGGRWMGRARKARSCVSTTVDGKWMVSFPEGWGAPAEIPVDTLKPWKDLPMSEEGRAFSGTATYTKTIIIDGNLNNSAYVLDLGEVEEIAEVFVNGKKVRTLWCYPYSLDITEGLVEGENEIRIEVTSTWFNRLAYDAMLPEFERKTWTIEGPEAGSELRPSGLLGPVTLIEYKR